MDIQYATIEELEAALAKKRQAVEGAPKILKNADFEALKTDVDSKLRRIAETGFVPSSFKGDVFALVLTTLYGDVVFEWLNSRTK